MINGPRWAGLTGFLVVIALLAGTTWVRAAVPLAQVGRGAAPVIDGNLAEPAWQACAQLLPFIKMGGEGIAEVRTRALVFYDDQRLYAGFRCDEPHMDKLVAMNTTRDSALWHDDCIEVLIHRPGTGELYHIIVNTPGVTFEAKDEETSWNPDLKAAVLKGNDRWSVELSVPWSQIGGPPKPGETWKANFCRERKVKSELSSWSCSHGRFTTRANFGEIVFAERAVRLDKFELGPQLPGANAARLKLALPGQAVAEISVAGADPIRTAAGSADAIELIYPIGLTDGDVVFEARTEGRHVWRCAIPVKIQPRPQLGGLDRPFKATRRFLQSLPADSPLRTPLQTTLDKAARAGTALREAIKSSLAENKPLDPGRYRKLNTAVGAEAASLALARWPVWTKNNWLNLDRTELPDTLEDLGQIDVKLLVNEYESANVILTNLSAEPLRLRLTATDLIWFTELPPTTRNLISNGSFETDANRDGVPDGWRHISGNRKSWRLQDDADHGRVIAIDCAKTGKLTIRQDLDLQPGRPYLLDLWARSVRATSTVRVGVINQGWTRARFCRGLTGTSGWHRIRRPIHVQSGPPHQLVIWVREGGRGTVWLDEIRLIEGADPAVRFEGTAPKLAVADWQELRGGSVVADPLIPLNGAGRLDVPPGESRQIWITLPARDLPPGRYECAVQATPLATVVDQGSPAGKAVRIQLDVQPVRLGTHPDFAVYNWDYALSGPRSTSEAYVRDLFDHKVNWFLVTTSMPRPKFDARGNPIGSADFAAYDRLLRIKGRYAREAGGQILFSYGIIRSFERSVSREYGYKFMDDAWVRAFTHTYTTWLAHLKALGLGYDAFCIQVWDEATGENVAHVVEAGKLLRKIDPKVRLVMDGAQSVEEVRRMDPYIDVWIPHLRSLQRPKAGPPLLEQYRKTGEPVHTYTCSVHMKSLSPYTYHRLKPWQAAKLGLDGVFYWAYNSWRGDPWNDFDGPIADCGAIYNGVDGPISSRRWEASREGIEDWQIMRLVERLAKVEGIDKQAATRARKLVDEALDTVLSKKDKPDLANRYRVKLIKTAVALAESNPLAVGAVAETMKGRDLIVTFKTNRPAAGKLLYRVFGDKAWHAVEIAEGTEHTVRVELPPFARADWIVVAWDALGRVATARRAPGAVKK